MSSVFRVWERFKYSIRAPWFSSVNNIFRDEDRGCVYTSCRSELTPGWQPSLHACGGRTLSARPSDPSCVYWGRYRYFKRPCAWGAVAPAQECTPAD